MFDRSTQCARLVAIVALAFLVSGCAAAYFGALNAGGEPDGVTVETIAYDAGAGLSLDVYRPATARAGAPIVVFFHGGSWENGGRRDYPFVARALAQRGIVAVVPDYRAYPQFRYPGFMTDPARAVAYVREHARAYGADPRRLFVAGHSSGAHIAALLGTDARYLARVGLAPRDLAGVIGIAGPYDFLPIRDPHLADIFGPRDGWRSSQPVNHVGGDEPPFLLLHGLRDRTVDPRNSDSLATKMRQARVPVVYHEYKKSGHVRILTAMRLPKLAPTLRDVVAFVESTPAAAR